MNDITMHVATILLPQTKTQLVIPLVQPGLFAHKYYSTTHNDAEEHWSYKGPHNTIVGREPAAEDTEMETTMHCTVHMFSACAMQVDAHIHM